MSSCFTIYVADTVLFEIVDGKIINKDGVAFFLGTLQTFSQKYGCRIKVFCLCHSDEEKHLKREWCKKEFGFKSNDIDIIKKHENKFCHADPLSLLIDTNEANVNTFIYAGGHAFLHTPNKEIKKVGDVEVVCNVMPWIDFILFIQDDYAPYKIEKLDDASELLEAELRYLMSQTIRKLDDWQYAYNYCLHTIFNQTEIFYAENSKKIKKTNAELSEKYKTIFSLYEEATKIKSYDNTPEFDPISFLESYPLIEDNTNGHGKNVFEQTVYQFKKHLKINLFDLPETKCKAILFYVYVNMFSTGILMGVNKKVNDFKSEIFVKSNMNNFSQ